MEEKRRVLHEEAEASVFVPMSLMLGIRATINDY